jgi:hypothetical protein
MLNPYHLGVSLQVQRQIFTKSLYTVIQLKQEILLGKT